MTSFITENWDKLLTGAIALYAACLSTYTAITERREKRRIFKVSVSNGFVTSGPNISEFMLILEASNPSSRPVTLVSHGLSLPSKRQMIVPYIDGSAALPHALQEGQRCSHWIPYEVVVRELKSEGLRGTVKIRGFYRDALGNRVMSKRFPINLDETK